MTFRVGQQVVCIKRDRWHELLCGETGPVFNGVYRIRGMDSSPPCLSLHFDEIRNPALRYREGPVECSFVALWFRPLVDKTTDIGFAHEILRKASRVKEAAA